MPKLSATAISDSTMRFGLFLMKARQSSAGCW